MTSPELTAPTGETTSINRIIDGAPDACAAARLLKLRARHGGAADAYLSLPDVDPYRESILDDFPEALLGTFDSRDELIEHELAALGFTTDLEEMLECHDIPAGLVSWNREAIWTLVTEPYDIVEQDGHLYVFGQ